MAYADDEKVREFPRYLAAVMIAANFVRPNGEPDVPALARASGLADTVVRRWLSGTVPTLENLRIVAPALRMDPRHLYVGAGLLLPEEAGLKEAPGAPQPPSIEDAIAADRHLTKRGKETLLYFIDQFEGRRVAEEEARREEEGPGRGQRGA